MYEPSKNTVYIAIAFTSIAALVGAYSYWDDVSYALCDVVKPELNNGEVRLVDDEGKSYTLINHGDGKETALYDDAEKSVTFHRDEKGNIIWDAGLASLIPTLAVGYYAFHGFSAPMAYMDAPSMRLIALRRLLHLLMQIQALVNLIVQEWLELLMK